MEFDGTNLFLTNSGTTRKTVAYTDSAMTGDGSGMTNLNAGNIATGTLAVARGGTGLGTTPTNGQLLIGNGSGYTLASLTGTANQIIVTPGSGSITLTLPQDIATTSTPTFGGLTLNGAMTGTTATFTNVKTGDGTVGAPGYAFSADATTGLYRPAAAQLAASVAGTRSMWITAGSVSLGSGALASDSAPATNNNVAVGALALFKNTTGSYNTALGILAGVPAGAAPTNSITGSNSTFVGANARVADTAQMASASNITLLGAGATASGITGANNQDVHMTAIGAGASVTSINTVVLGRAADSVVVGGTAAGGELFHVYGTAGGTSGFATSSDIRYKTNITPVINALETIGNLKGVHYEFNQAAFPQHGFESGRQLGFIAQQIEPFVPEVVRTDRFGFKSVQYSQLVPLLAEGINAQQLILKHLSLKDPATLLVDIKTFQGNDAVFENIKATGIKVALLEAETAKIKKLEADSIESKMVRSDVVKSGEIEVFVSMGSFQPIFAPLADAQYIVNAIADDGSSAFASVAFMGGRITVTPISGKGVDVTAMGAQVGLVAASKKVKATWIRMS